MIIKDYLMRLLAMSEQMPRAELRERCGVSEEVLNRALTGQDIEIFDVHSITDAVKLWDGGTDVN